MRYVLLIPVFFLLVSSAQAQDTKRQRINQAIDDAERICLVGNRYKFEVDASGQLTISSKLLPGGKVTVDRAQAKGRFFQNEDVRRLVGRDIRECMKSQWSDVLQVMGGS